MQHVLDTPKTQLTIWFKNRNIATGYITIKSCLKGNYTLRTISHVNSLVYHIPLVYHLQYIRQQQLIALIRAKRIGKFTENCCSKKLTLIECPLFFHLYQKIMQMATFPEILIEIDHPHFLAFSKEINLKFAIDINVKLLVKEPLDFVFLLTNYSSDCRHFCTFVVLICHATHYFC